MTTAVDPISNYSTGGMQEELQRIIRIQDWDIVVKVVSGDFMYRRFGHDEVKGECIRDRDHRSALIFINRDHPDHEAVLGDNYLLDGWLATLIHEFIHIFVDDYAYIAEATMEEENPLYKYFDSQLRLQLESMVNRITRMIISLIDVQAFLNRHRKDESNGSTTETSE